VLRTYMENLQVYVVDETPGWLTTEFYVGDWMYFITKERAVELLDPNRSYGDMELLGRIVADGFRNNLIVSGGHDGDREWATTFTEQTPHG
ncbi:hypothetical protein LCGC14_2200460, partial [marine sediment metagenome]